MVRLLVFVHKATLLALTAEHSVSFNTLHLLVAFSKLQPVQAARPEEVV